MLDLALFVLLALAAPPTSAPAGAPEGEPPDLYQDPAPPAGTDAEVQLWKAGFEVTRNVWQARTASTRLRNKVFQSELGKRLKAAAAGPEREEAEDARKTYAALEAAEARNLELYRRAWPVDPYRVCSNAHLLYDSAMRLPPGPNRQAEVANAAPDLKGCTERAGAALQRMMDSNLELDAIILKTEKVLAEADHEAREHAERQEKAKRK